MSDGFAAKKKRAASASQPFKQKGLRSLARSPEFSRFVET
jgi:hypothetical protein